MTRIRHVELRDEKERVLLENDFRSVDNLAPPDEFILKEARLASPNASMREIGVARVQADQSSARLRAEIERLPSDGRYEIIADGLTLATATARSGFVRVDFTTDGSGGQPFPPMLRSAINLKGFDVQDSSGEMILRGSFKIEGGSIGRVPH